MRKQQKQEILDFLKNLDLAHEEIRKAVHADQWERVCRMFSECQQFVIELGTNIEKLEGEGQVTVSYLEEYCEMLYQILKEWAGQPFQENRLQKLLKKQLLKIENSVKNDIAIQKEIVFFPYKASMWDSLESVYLALQEESDCDVYCVPIPYYERNQDQSLGLMHYEGGQYPKNIRVTDWQAYRFEERKPDEIYIHNAYDNCNSVTSVHPRFYSGNLKQYTEKLVYIPYFILDEVDPDNAAAVKSISHFCFLPGIVYADKVILQSENMKRIYVNEYRKAALANGLTGEFIDRKYLEQKFLGLGSPKIDKVLHTKKESLEIPQAWLQVIQKSDGDWKKIVLYNTGLTALLEYNEKWLQKIREVFKIFKEKQGEITLLWRPHPLIENTMKSMRPGILEQYLELKKQYIAESWGIFDDTADLDRAIVLSDAYYGDGSSVAQLYKKTGKPLMFQDVRVKDSVKESSLEIPIWPSVFCIAGKDIWFVHGKINCLMHYETEKRRLYLAGSIPCEKTVEETLYSGICLYGQKLFLVPCCGEKIAVYDIGNQTFCQKQLKRELGLNGRLMFCAAFQSESDLICIPYQYPAIVKINMVDLEADDVFECIDYIKKQTLDEASYINCAVQMDDGKIMCVVPGTNKLFFYSIPDNKMFFCEIKDQYRHDFKSAAAIGNEIFLYDAMSRRVYRYQIKSGVLSDTNLERENCRLSNFNREMFLVDDVEKSSYTIVNRNLENEYEATEFSNRSECGLGPDYYDGKIFYDKTEEVTYYFDTCIQKMFLFDHGKATRHFCLESGTDTYGELRKMILAKREEIEKENELYRLEDFLWGLV